VFVGIGFLLPRASTGTAVLLALTFSCGVEFSQLCHAPWIDAIRATLAGRMVGQHLQLAGPARLRAGHRDRSMGGVAVAMNPLGKNFMIDGLNRPGELKALITTLKHPLENRLTIEREQPGRPDPGR